MAQITLKGSPIHTTGELPGLHTIAPAFKLVDTDLKERELNEFKGKRKLLSIVPSLDNPPFPLSFWRSQAKRARYELNDELRGGTPLTRRKRSRLLVAAGLSRN